MEVISVYNYVVFTKTTLLLSLFLFRNVYFYVNLTARGQHPDFLLCMNNLHGKLHPQQCACAGTSLVAL
jgi:hypothetical protein